MAKIMWQGQEVEAVEIDFRSVREDWNEYDLKDGSTLRIKVVLADINRIEGKFDGEGNPIYVVKSGNLVVVKAPDHLKGKI